MRKTKLYSRICSAFLAITMLATSMPTMAFATEPSIAEEEFKEESGAGCICAARCTLDAPESNCPICGAENADLTTCAGKAPEGLTEEPKEESVEEPVLCSCAALCAEGAVDAACPICGVENADLSACIGKAAEPELEEKLDSELECVCEFTCSEDTINTECPACSENFEDCKVEFHVEAPEIGTMGARVLTRFRKGRSAIITDKANFDVFVNVDPKYGVSSDDMVAKIQTYLDKLIAAGHTPGSATPDPTYRFKTTSVKIDPTDLTKWNVYDHYDKGWFDSQANWDNTYLEQSNQTALGAIPSNWYYYASNDTASSTTNGKTTIKEILEKNGNGKTWNKTGVLREHINTGYEGTEDAKRPFMQFYGYQVTQLSDFLYYPASASSTKNVIFDVDASKVYPHTLKYAGFLINAGVGEDGYMKGSLLLFEYGPSGGSTYANSLIGTYLVDIAAWNVTPEQLHGYADGATTVTTAKTPTNLGSSYFAQSSGSSFWSQSRITMEIKPTSLTVKMQELDLNGDVKGTEQVILDKVALSDSGLGGFGPYVYYNGHGCNDTSSYRFSNLQMNLVEQVGGNSALDALQYSDYLQNSDQRFFVNITSPGEDNYAQIASDLDKGYLTRMDNEKIILLTDESGNIYPDTIFGDNTYDANLDVTDDNISGIFTGADSAEKMAAQMAWLIYNKTWTAGGSITTPDTVAVANVMLMDSAPADQTPEKPWGTALQVNSIQKELISGKQKIYLNPDESVNAENLTPVYTMEFGGKTYDMKLNATAPNIPLMKDGVSGKLYFEVDNTWAAGSYTVKLDFARKPDSTPSDPTNKVTVATPNSTALNILTDTLKPAIGATTVALNNSTLTGSLNWVNTPSTGNNVYTSNLASYAVVIDKNSASPAVPGAGSRTAITNNALTATFTYPLTDSEKTPGDYYMHVFLWDAAGNAADAKSVKFTVEAPVITMTKPGDNRGDTASNRYGKGEGESIITFGLTEKTFPIVSYEIGAKDKPDFETTTVPVDESTALTGIEYTLPHGQYQLYIKTTDSKGNEIEKTLYVDARKQQIITDTAHTVEGKIIYTLEGGVDGEAALIAISTSNPALDIGDNLSEITYALKAGASADIVTLANGKITPKQFGTTTIVATAAETDTHSKATEEITVAVIPPLSVALTPTYAKNQITVNPAHKLGAYPLNSTVSTLQYRERGTEEWKPIEGWKWGENSTLAFDGLKPNTDYEIRVSAEDTRTSPKATEAHDSVYFRTPAKDAENGAGKGEGTGNVKIVGIEPGKNITISIEKGGIVFDSAILTGDGKDLSKAFEKLPDGVYNVVGKYDGATITEIMYIKDGKLVDKDGNDKAFVTVDFSTSGGSGSKSSIIVRENDKAPDITADTLGGMYTAANATETNKGITADDMTEVSKGATALIELKVKDVEEEKLGSDTPEEILAKQHTEMIKTAAGSQRVAFYTDLTLQKTITQNGAVAGVTTQLIESNDLLTIYIPLPEVNGKNFKVFRVHENGVTPATEAEELGDKDHKNTDGEYCEITDNQIILHVKKFSLYAVTYTKRSSGSGSADTSVNVGVDSSTSAGGDVTISKDKPNIGDKVVVTIKPDDGYVLDDLIIKDKNGNDIAYTDNGDGTFSFVAPTRDVTIKPVFRPLLEDVTVTGVAELLNTDDHIRYMIGDTRGNFNPLQNMTRAEVAQMFYNLLRDKNIAATVKFGDVADDAWYADAVNKLASMGIIRGYNGKYRPDDSVTRAEFTKIAVGFAKATGGEKVFSDVSKSHWAYAEIQTAAAYGWIMGNPDGTFKPDNDITRSEVVKIVNNMLGRIPDKSYIKEHVSTLKIFPDAADKDFWAWYLIVEATNAHDYDKADGVESWTKLQ